MKTNASHFGNAGSRGQSKNVLALALAGFVLCPIFSHGSSPPGQTVRLQFLKQKGSPFAVKLGQEVVPASRLRARNGLTLASATLALSAEGVLKIHAGHAPLSVQVEGLNGWAAGVDAGAEASFQLDHNFQTVFVQVPLGTASVALDFPDGAAATVEPESLLRYDQFQDGSYLASGSGRIAAKDADGKQFVLGARLPPMAGGPLLRVTGQNRPTHFKRLRPPVELELWAGPEIGYVLTTEGRQIYPSPQGNQVRLPNGSILHLQPDPQEHSLSWTVVRGDFLLRVKGLPEWRANLWSGQTVELIVDSTIGAVDLQNLCPQCPVVAALPNRNFARIEPKAVFQFLRLNELTFAASASRGQVILINSFTGDQTDLGQGHLVSKKALETDVIRTNTTDHVNLAWLESGEVEVIGALDRFQLSAGQTQVLTGTSGAQLRVSLTKDGVLAMEAESGNFDVVPARQEGVTVHLIEGDSFLLNKASASGLLSGAAGPENRRPVRVTAQGGLTVTVPPAADLMILAPQLSFAAAASASAIFSEKLEPMGQTGSSTEILSPGITSGSSSFVRDPGAVYQPPVSVHGTTTD